MQPTRHQESHPRLMLPVLAGAFFASGFSALLYQVVWQRMLGLFTGSDVRSATIVIAAYLAGLGAGSLLGSFFADRLSNRQAVWAFGFCNLGIAVFAFLSRFLFYDLLFSRLSMLAQSPAVMLLVAFISLLWPTVLMGLSLPLLSKALVRSRADAAGRISLLYGINTLGAGVGTLVAGWYLIGTLGYDRAAAVGGGLSAVVGLAALLVAFGFSTADHHAAAATSVKLDLRQVPRAIWIWCALVFASGFIAISLELIWFRILGVLLVPTAYTFAHLLAFILVGYAVGSLLGAGVVRRIQTPRQVFLWIQGLVALYAVATVFAIFFRYDVLAQYLAETKGYTVAPRELVSRESGYIFGYIILPALMLLPPNLLIGFYFPIVQKAVQTDDHVVGQRVGLVQVANIIGNTAGSILTGIFLLQFVGTAGALRVISVLGLLFILVLIWENAARWSVPGRFASGLLAAALLVTAVSFPTTGELWSRLHGGTPSDSIVAEDSTGIAVLRRLEGSADLYANGEVQGTVPFLGVHGFLGSLPALVHPDPENVMAIGIGSGGTPYGLGVNPATQRILAVELIGTELDVLSAYAKEERGLPIRALLNDTRYRIVVGDGRRELALSNVKFDIIEADALLPWRSHSGLLYSQEFFEEARTKLADGGIVAQWNSSSRVNATFLSVFPYGVRIGELLLLGSNQPIEYDKEKVLARLEDPRILDYFTRGGIDPNEIRESIDAHGASFWTPDRPIEEDINTDLLPKDEYYLNNSQ